MPHAAEDRFWHKARRAGPNDCWLWVGARDTNNYGIFRLDGRVQAAHRVSYKMHNGAIPDSMVVHHQCHTRPCVNPRHLVAVPFEVNARDRRVDSAGARNGGATVGAMARSLEDRFWEKVRKDSDSGCWIWTAAANKDGYGSIGVGNGRTKLAHRVAWEMARGPIPHGKILCHNCPTGDNPSCVNPDHLYVGTDADNARDQITKGQVRRATGARSGRRLHPESYFRGNVGLLARLGEDEVIGIRCAYADGASINAIAEDFLQHPSTIADIVYGRSYARVGGSIAQPGACRPLRTSLRQRGEAQYNAKLTADIVRRIRARFAEGRRQVDIAQDLDISKYTVNDIVRRKSWKHID